MLFLTVCESVCCVIDFSNRRTQNFINHSALQNYKSPMRLEIDKGVETFHRIALGTKKDGPKLVPEGKLASFVTILTELLLKKYKDSWHPEEPDRGSGYRCLRVNRQAMDPTIMESLKRAEIDMSDGMRTVELTIWIDPGVVSVRIGEDGSIGSEVVDEEVYNMRLKAKPKLSVSSEGASTRSSSPTDSIDSTASGSSSGTSSPPPSYQFVKDYDPYSPPRHGYRQPPPATAQYNRPRNVSPVAPQFQPVMLGHGNIPTDYPPQHPKMRRPIQQRPVAPMDYRQAAYGEGNYRLPLVQYPIPPAPYGYGQVPPPNYLDIPAMA